MCRLGLFLILWAAAVGAQTSPAGKPVSSTPGVSPTTRPAESKSVKAESVTINMPEGMTKDQADAILNELKAIHQLLLNAPPTRAAAAAPAPAAAPSDKVKMSVGTGWYAMGPDDAPVTMVEFTDYQCPFCRRFEADSFAQLKKEYIDTGKVR